MTTRTFRTLALVAAVAATLPTSAALAQTQPAADVAPATNPAGRTFDAVIADLQTVGQELAEVMSDPQTLLDAEQRQAKAGEAVPKLRRMDELMAEAAQVAPAGANPESLRSQRYGIQAMLVAFGDESAKAALQGEEATAAKGALLMGRFINAEGEARRAVVDDLAQLAEEQPSDPAVLETTMGVMQFAAVAEDEASADAAKAILNDTLQGEMADAIKQQMAAQDASGEGFKARHMGKELDISTQTLQGESFDLDSLKGKVVLVDFWATWCGPCIAALPDLKKNYKQYKDQGFEIVGVSLDQSAEPLKAFLEKDAEMSWPQLFTVGNPQATQKISTDLGITGIPTVFLLDKSGKVRGVAVGTGPELDKLKGMIPELLKEEANNAG